MDKSQDMSHQAGQAVGQAKVSLALVSCPMCSIYSFP